MLGVHASLVCGRHFSTDMNIILQNLLKLQALEFGETTEKNTEAQVADLRTKVPPPILGHYDRLRARGKKGVAIVRNQSCTGCHMHVPIGMITVLMRGEDVQLCESCGRYLYLPDPAENEFVQHMEAAKPAPKARRRRALAPAA
jgi:predicted  nucleic acid-binding Zn-ribbon protein